jgi:DNA invertase Pin-like site-specific DNA recombinase
MQRRNGARRHITSGNGAQPELHVSDAPVDVLAVGYVTGRGFARIDDPELRHQAAAIEGFCVRRGWTLVALVRDVEPLNGSARGRPSLKYAIDRLRAGHATCLVVAELKRLCTSVAELGVTLDALEQSGARLVSLDPPIDTGTQFGRAAARMLKSVSLWECARRAEMTSAARAKVAILQAIRPELKRQIVRMRRAGMTLQAIADELNEEGVPTVRGGRTWRPSSVQAALGYKRPRL